MSIIRRIIEKRIGKGILSEKELVQWEKDFNEVSKKIGWTVEEYLTSTRSEQDAFWEVFGKHVKNKRESRKENPR